LAAVSDDLDDDVPARGPAGASAPARAPRLLRWLPYAPPLAAVGVAAAAFAVAHARPVFGARILAGARPEAGAPLTARAIVVRHDGGGLGRIAQLEVRVRGEGVRGQASVTDEEGVSELRLESPLPPSFEVEGKLEGAWLPLAHVELSALPPSDPKLGMLDVPRSSGRASGALVVAAAPERTALVPQVPGAAWVRVQRRDPHAASGLQPVEAARVTIVGDAGVSETQGAALTDVSGLARVRLTPGAPPVMITVKAEKDGLEGAWEGTLGAVYATPYPAGDGALATGLGAVDVVAPTSLRRAYWDLWRAGARVGGGAIAFDANHKGALPLPRDAAGAYDLELSSSADPQSSEDLSHAIAWPLVIAKDPVEGLSALLGDPRFDRAIPPPTGSLRPWSAALPATIAFARASIPRRDVVAYGLDAAFAVEQARGQRVRRWATVAIVAAALIEIAIVLQLGLFSRSAHADAEIEALLREEGDPGASELDGRAPPRTRKLASMVVGALGIVTLIFAALAIMAAGLR
jgi:hypothetical protein